MVMVKSAGLLFVVVIVALVVAACGGGAQEASPTAAAGSTPSPSVAPLPTSTPSFIATTVATTSTAQPTAAPATPTPRPTAVPPTQTLPGPAPKYGGTMAWRVPRDYAAMMDVRTGTGRFSTVAGLTMLNNLAVFSPTDFSKVASDLAEKWDISQDGKVWTFSLRGDVRWHDGTPFTSKDVTFTLDRYLNPETPAATVQKNRFAAVASVEAPDPRTIKFTLKDLSASFAIAIFDPSAVIYPAHLPFFEDKWKNNPVGTGPFTFASRTPNVVASVVRNPQYFKKDATGRALPYLDRVDQFVIADRALLLGAFASGNLSCLCAFPVDLLLDEIDSVRRLVPNAKVEIVGSATVLGLYFNSKPPFDNQKVRQAVHVGIARKEINAVLDRGSGYYPPSYLVPLGLGGQWALPEADVLKMPGFREPKDQDSALAKQLFREAGVDPSTVSLNIPLVPRWESVAQALDAELVKLGFKRSRLNVNIDAAIAYSRGEFDLAFAEYPSANDPSESLQNYVLSDGGNNYVKWSYPQIDSLIKQQDRTLDPARRRELLWDLQRQLYDLAYHVPMLNVAAAYAAHAYVEGFPLKRSSTVTEAHRLEAVWFNR